MRDLIDTHAHLDDASFDADREAMFERAREAGISAQVVPGVDRASWSRIDSLRENHAGVHAAYGLHPLFLDNHRDTHLDDLPRWLGDRHAVAVGEIGLDFYIEGLDADRQRRFFHEQLDMAEDTGLPVILHARRAVEEVTQAVKKRAGLRGVVHSFSGSQEQANNLWKLGFHLGIGGPVTYERAHRLRDIVARMPIEFLLLETDAPDQPCAHRRGQRNEPAFMLDVLEAVATLRGESPDEVAAATSANARRLFGI
ncbi:TatD DNase family protein [Luteibacter sp. Sphag1AF]|uniref:TatD family hydrolase n=1 Tax=Luteibacter sp. Sphag1AF TaxID=2587031 RepID=UPI00161D7DC1|nr:TatD family hydrolase [Luteibacter sp. Sphag1AF]MBB3228397.1 TatD DNase family protein [Luteibacter sp. Sphag1AF]